MTYTLLNREEQREKNISVCERKRRYPDEITARVFGMDSIQKTDAAMSLYVYRCEVCAGWHLTRFHVGTPITANDPFYVKEHSPKVPHVEPTRLPQIQSVEAPQIRSRGSYGYLRRRKTYQATA